MKLLTSRSVKGSGSAYLSPSFNITEIFRNNNMVHMVAIDMMISIKFGDLRSLTLGFTSELDIKDRASLDFIGCDLFGKGGGALTVTQTKRGKKAGDKENGLPLIYKQRQNILSTPRDKIGISIVINVKKQQVWFYIKPKGQVMETCAFGWTNHNVTIFSMINCAELE